MKKKFLLLWLLVAGFLFSAQSSAACQTVKFSNGDNFCFDITKQSSTTFQAITSSRSLTSSLTCQLTLPDKKVVELANCEGTFTYNGSANTIQLRADSGNYFSQLVTNYDFSRGSFDGNYSSQPTIYDELRFYSVTPSSPRVEDRIDVGVRVLSNGSIDTSTTQRVDFSVEEYRNGNWQYAYSADYELAKASYSFSYSDRGEVMLNRLLKLRKQGEFRLVAKLGNNSYYQSFKIGTSNSNASDTLGFYNVSTTRPSRDTWVSVGVRALRNGYTDTSFLQRVDFSVEEYRNGNWQSAYSADYSLSREYYSFSSPDRGEAMFNNLLRFTTQGRFRLVATARDRYSTRAYQEFDVAYDTNYYPDSRIDEISISSVYPSNPKRWEWIDLTLKAYDRNGYLFEDYQAPLRFELEKKENGIWRTAPSADYDLARQDFYFYRSDRGTKTFNDVLRFTTAGEYRLSITDGNDYSRRDMRYFSVEVSSSSNSSYDSYSYGNFTDREFKKVKAIYELWPQVIVLLKKDYYRLRIDSKRATMSDTFYQNMKAVVNNNRWSFSNFNDFYKAFMDWFSYTSRAR